MKASGRAIRPTVEEAVGLLLQNDGQTFRLATELLFKIVTNVLREPGNPAYRTLNRGGEAFSGKVAAAKGGIRFVRALGFVETPSAAPSSSHNGASTFCLPEGADLEALERGKAALKEAVREYARRVEAMRSADDAAAAAKLSDLRALSKRNSAQRDGEARAERDSILAGVSIDRADWVRQRDPTNFK